MTPQQLFGVVIRSTGLYLLLTGLHYISTAFYFWTVNHPSHYDPPMEWLIYGILDIPVSLYLLRGAPGLARFCYPRAAGTEQPSP